MMMREPDFVDECYADKDLSLLKKLTLVIPTYNRNYYLSRCLWYHAHFPFGEIIVADSSPEEKKVVNRETVAKVREIFGANVRYLEYEPETEKYGGDIYRKWGDAVQHVETEYSEIVTEKEFLIPSTLCKCIIFLSCNMDYVIASGKYLSYDGNIRGKYYGRMSSVDDNPIDRYCKNISKGWKQSTFMSLFRSEQHKMVYSPILSNKIDIRFGERYLEFAGYIYGKMKYFDDDIFNIRDIEYVLKNHIQNKDESSSIRYPQMKSYNRQSPKYNLTCDWFKTTITKLLAQKSKLNSEIVEIVFEKKIKPYIIRDALDWPDWLYPIFMVACRMMDRFSIKPNVGDLDSKMSKEVEAIISLIKSVDHNKLYDQPVL